MKIERGRSFPFGATWTPEGINFSVYAKAADKVYLCLFSPSNISQPYEKILLHQTGEVWHILIKELNEEVIYCYELQRQENTQCALDPYAKSIHSDPKWGHSSPYYPLAKVYKNTFDWEGDQPLGIPKSELIIYEMHARGFTCHASSQVGYPGTFKGIIEKIPYLKDLGINAIEFMPIQEFDEEDVIQTHPDTKVKLRNYFGYSTVNFFSPMNRYAAEHALDEFKSLVKELHKNGIEVILDVVFNHTFEGNEKGPTLSYKAFDPHAYYLIKDNQYLNYSGCGNTFNCNHPIAMELIIQALRHWVLEYHVDGFRFDLASVFNRGTEGEPLEKAPIVEFLTKDPVLSSTLLIAEPWDPGGLYQVGYFAAQAPRWSDWNGKYQESVRSFIKGTPNYKGLFASALSGSRELFPHPLFSGVNYIVSHDGFTLRDVVSYNEKHNLANGEDNKDGMNENRSWNSGQEGETESNRVLHLRQKQMRNFHLALMLSQGIPMLFMGDEYGHTRNGNNNPWGQDNELNWFLWDKLDRNDFFNYYKFLIHFRKNCPLLHSENLIDKGIKWHGLQPDQPEWERDNKFVAFTLHHPTGEPGLYAAFNSSHRYQNLILPVHGEGKAWQWVINTTKSQPYDEGMSLHENTLRMAPYSSILLEP